MSWKTLLLLSASTLLVACSPSSPAPSAEAPAPKKPLPADFLGIEIGKPLVAPACVQAANGAYTNTPCKTVLGKVAIDENKVPLGMESELDVSESGGVVDQVVAKIDRGDVAHIVNTMKEKYGYGYATNAASELHWSDETLAVAYVPAGPHEYGLIIVASQRRVQDDNRRTGEEKARTL